MMDDGAPDARAQARVLHDGLRDVRPAEVALWPMPQERLPRGLSSEDAACEVLAPTPRQPGPSKDGQGEAGAAIDESPMTALEALLHLAGQQVRG